MNQEGLADSLRLTRKVGKVQGKTDVLNARDRYAASKVKHEKEFKREEETLLEQSQREWDNSITTAVVRQADSEISGKAENQWPKETVDSVRAGSRSLNEGEWQSNIASQSEPRTFIVCFLSFNHLACADTSFEYPKPHGKIEGMRALKNIGVIDQRQRVHIIACFKRCRNTSLKQHYGNHADVSVQEAATQNVRAPSAASSKSYS